MKTWTDNIVDSPASVGEEDTIKAVHVTEIRDEIAKASLWVPWLDERTPFISKSERLDIFHDEAVFTLSGAGVVRNIFIAGLPAAAYLDFYYDGELTPRISASVASLGGSLVSGQSPYLSRYWGFTDSADFGSYHAFYFGLPIPFRSGLICKLNYAPAAIQPETIFVNITGNTGTSVDYGRYNFLQVADTSSSLAAFATHTIASVSGKGSGAVVGLVHAIDGGSTNAFEGNHTITIDGNQLSYSGVEDIFLHSYYFEAFSNLTSASRDWSQAQQLMAGMLFKDIATARICAYRIFEPAFPFESTMGFSWKNGDTGVGSPGTSTSTAVLYYYTEE